MKIVYDILKEFQSEFGSVYTKMHETSHHFDFMHKNHLNKYHLEGDVWTHTMMVLNSYINDNDKPDINHDIMAVTLLCHDIGKVYTRDLNNNDKVTFYGHGYASVQPCIDFIFHLNEKGITNFTSNQIYNILCVISNHIKYYSSTDQKRSKIYNNDKELYTLFESLLKYDRMGSIRDYEDDPCDFKNNEYIENNKEDEYKKEFPKLTLYAGVPATGKNFLAYKNNFDSEIMSYDELRIKKYIQNNSNYSELLNDELYKKAFEYCNKNNIKLKQILINEINKVLKSGKNVTICNTNLTKKERKIISNFKKKYHIELNYIVSKSSTIYERDKLRDSHNLSENIVDKFMFNQQVPMYIEGFDKINVIIN